MGIEDNTRETYETKPVRIWAPLDAFRQVPARHPFRNKLKRGEGDTQEGNDVWMRQAFTHYSLLEENLWGSLDREIDGFRRRTFVAFSGPSLEYTLMRLTQMLRPLRVPLKISPEPPEATGRSLTLSTGGEKVYGVGSIILLPHILLSSRRHFRKQGLAGSRILRVYAVSSRGG